LLFKLQRLLQRILGTNSDNDFPRSRDSHYILQAILPNIRDFDLFYERICEDSLEFTPSADLKIAYSYQIDRYVNYFYDNKRFVHAMPGIIENYRIAFTNEPLLLPDARLHQLLYFQDQLMLIDARIPYRPGNQPDTLALETKVGPLKLPTVEESKRPFLAKGFRDHAGRMLWYESEVNQHLRFLVNPKALQDLLEQAHRQINLSKHQP